MKTLEMTFLGKTKRFFSPLQKVKKISTQSAILGVFEGFNPFVHVYFIQLLVGKLEQGLSESFQLIFLYYLVYFLCFEGFELLTHKWGWYKTEPTIKKIIFRDYIKDFVKLNNNKVEQLGTGKIITIVGNGINVWKSHLSNFVHTGPRLITIFLITTIYLVSLSIYALLIFAILLGISSLIMIFCNKRMIYYRKQGYEHSAMHGRNFVKIIMSKMEVLQNDKINHEEKELSNNLDMRKHYNLKMSPYFHTFFKLPRFTITCIKLGLLYFMSSYIFSGELTISTFVFIFGVMAILEQTILQFVDFFKGLTRDFIEIEKLWQFFDETPEMQGYDTGKEFQIQKGNIMLKDVSYGYDEKTTVFKNFNLKLKGGNITALVGPSGGGKSTLVKLIAGYIHANSGNIIIDNQRISEISLKSYYKEIGYLTQEPSVFDGTIRDNLSYALETEVSDLEIEKVLKLAQCDFIFDFTDGVDTEIGEKGIRLSGGQRQRLAIAKIFLKNPKIIILDEPTSALDSFSEALIATAMNNLFKGRTVIVIAHRLQTVKHADQIIYIQDGKIVEDGDHKSLVKQKGLYNDMLELQSGF